MRTRATLIVVATVLAAVLLPPLPAATAVVSQILCVNPAGGVAVSPCANRTAYRTIQEAVDVARTDAEIRVAAGVYTDAPSGQANVFIRARSFTLVGGFTPPDWTNPGPNTATVIDAGGVRQGIIIQQIDYVGIANLTITGGAALPWPGNQSGGGIYAPEPYTWLDLVNVRVVNSSAADDGGAVYSNGLVVVRGGEFADNRSQSNGGAIYARFADIDGALFQRNRADSEGGALYVQQDTVTSNSDFRTNQASSGGAAVLRLRGLLFNLYAEGNQASNGGAVVVEFEGTNVRIIGGAYVGNTATEAGGAIRAMAPVSLHSLLVSGNRAQRGGGIFTARPATVEWSVIAENTATTDGGGIFALNDLALRVVTLADNTATSDGGAVFHDNYSFTNDPRQNLLELSGAEVTGNRAGRGGALAVYGPGTLRLGRSRIAGNQASGEGGGLYHRANPSVTPPPAIDLRGGVFFNNTAGGNGGGLSLRLPATIRSTEIVSNTATLNGGGIYGGPDEPQAVTYDPRLSITGSLLGDNRAAQGNGISLPHIVQLDIVNVTLASSTLAPGAAIDVGGGGGTIMLTNTAVTSHTVGLARPDGSTLLGDYNAFFGNASDQQVNGVTADLPFGTVLRVDPGFRDPPGHDYHLHAGSALINAADPARDYTGQLDVDFGLVPATGGPDLGGDEFYPLQLPLPRVAR